MDKSPLLKTLKQVELVDYSEDELKYLGGIRIRMEHSLRVINKLIIEKDNLRKDTNHLVN